MAKFAANEVGQSATYPSPYANVSKFTLCIPNGTIGTAWVATTSETREKHLQPFKEQLDKLPNLSEKAKHEKTLEYYKNFGSSMHRYLCK